MTEWRRLAPGTGGRDPAAVLALMQRAALANRRIRERSQEIAAWCGAIVEQATRDLTAIRARLEAAEAHAETAEGRARAAETQVEELELWLNRIEALLSEELAAPGLPAADDPFDGLLESQDRGRCPRRRVRRISGGPPPRALRESAETGRHRAAYSRAGPPRRPQIRDRS